MSAVTSNDGTRIAFDRVGRGPALVVVGGAFSYRGWKGNVEIADLLPESRRRTLEGQSHNVSMKVLAPVVEGFLGGGR
jgi:hypothetical protein